MKPSPARSLGRRLAFASMLALALATASAAGSCEGASTSRAEAFYDGDDSPISYARWALDQALAEAGSSAVVHVSVAHEDAARALFDEAGAALDARPESFAILGVGGETHVIGRDETGALYGALELAERLRDEGAGCLPPRAPITGSPRTPIRGANLFVALPEGEDLEPSWWFTDERFWGTYLDLLARARFDFLDLQGMYDVASARFPNALLYFAESESFPSVGAPPAIRERNLAMLRRVVSMARARGIRVGLLSNRADTSLVADGDGALTSEDDLARYEREASADLARRAPGLARLGFRIGESKEPARFYRTSLVEGARAGAPAIGLTTRTWLTDKPEIVGLAEAAHGDLWVEAKYNGEQIGPPYLMAGGLMSEDGGWSRYSYEDYLEPPAPYTFLFQIWGGGTHRLFRHASLDRIRRTVEGARLGASQGFTLLATHAFMPQRDFYHRDEADRFSPWAFRRDELEYLLFGRLAYDPTTPERVFRKALADRTGTDALWDAVQAAGEIVPFIQAAHTFGPDQRFFAPDLEWGGPVGEWAGGPRAATSGPSASHTGYCGPFDTFAIASPHATAAALVDHRGLGTIPSTEIAARVLEAAGRARAALAAPIDPDDAEARDVVRECAALADLGDYFGHKLIAATALAVFDESGREDYLDAARDQAGRAGEAWAALAEHTGYIAPFPEPMRMARLGFETYHWSFQSTATDATSIEEHALARAAEAPRPDADELPSPDAWLFTRRGEGPGLEKLAPTPPAAAGGPWSVALTFKDPVPAGAEVRVLYKAFSGKADWQSAAASGEGRAFSASIPGLGPAAFFAAEVTVGPALGFRYPDALATAPYVVVAPAP